MTKGKAIMKMMKQVITLILLTVFVISMMTACGKKQESEQTSNATNTTSNKNEATTEKESDVVTEKQFDGPPFEIVLELVTLGQDFTSIPLIEEALNEITLKEINATIKLYPLHIKDHATKLNLMVASGEKLDLVLTGITTPLAGLVANNILLPLDDLLAQYGSDLMAKQGDLLDAKKINGEIYAVTANLYPASAGGIMYNQEIAQAAGLNMKAEMTLEEISALGEQVKAAGYYLTTPGDGGLNSFNIYYDINQFGGNYAYGVIFDPYNQTEIVNFYKSPEFRDFALLMKSWRDNGYIPADALTNGQNGQDVFRTSQILYQWTNLSPLDIVSQSNAWPFKVGFTQTTAPSLTTENIQQFGYGIPVHCEKPEVVMQFLNLLYTNAEVSNLLNSGIEGVEYQKVSDNIIEYVEGINYGNAGYVRIFNRFGDAMQTYQWTPATEDYYNELKLFNERATKSRTLGYVFNAEPVATELAAINSVVAEFRPPLIAGAVDDVDVALAAFNKALDAAGMETVIEENRKQLEAWLVNQ